jgi:hypothetical protein
MNAALRESRLPDLQEERMAFESTHALTGQAWVPKTLHGITSPLQSLLRLELLEQ